MSACWLRLPLWDWVTHKPVVVCLKCRISHLSGHRAGWAALRCEVLRMSKGLCGPLLARPGVERWRLRAASLRAEIEERDAELLRLVGEEVPAVDHRRGQVAMVDHGSATRSPVRAGVALVVFGGLVAHELEGIAAFDQGLALGRQAFQFDGFHLGAILFKLWEASDRICGKRLRVMIPT